MQTKTLTKTLFLSILENNKIPLPVKKSNKEAVRFTIKGINTEKQLLRFSCKTDLDTPAIEKIIAAYGFDHIDIISWHPFKPPEKLSIDVGCLAHTAWRLAKQIVPHCNRIGNIRIRNNKVSPVKQKLSPSPYLNPIPVTTFRCEVFFLLFKDIPCFTLDNYNHYTRRHFENITNNYEDARILFERSLHQYPADLWHTWIACIPPNVPELKANKGIR